MICYGNNCNSGSIHRNVQPEHSAETVTKKTVAKSRPKTTRSRNGRQVKCLENEKVYQSITQAANDLKVDRSNISAALNGLRLNKSVKGYHFEFV